MKTIQPFELAQIVATLLANPKVLGELDSGYSYGNFVEAIGQVVGEYCGGDATVMDRSTAPKLIVYYNDSLPSLHRNVWAMYDPSGKLDYIFTPVESDEEPMSEAEMNTRRQAVQAELLSLAAKVQQG